VDVEAPVPCSKFDEPDIIWACKVVDFTPTGNFAWSQRQVKRLLSGGFFGCSSFKEGLAGLDT
jgi:hypothetical protein